MSIHREWRCFQTTYHKSHKHNILSALWEQLLLLYWSVSWEQSLHLLPTLNYATSLSVALSIASHVAAQHNAILKSQNSKFGLATVLEIKTYVHCENVIEFEHKSACMNNKPQ